MIFANDALVHATQNIGPDNTCSVVAEDVRRAPTLPTEVCERMIDHVAEHAPNPFIDCLYKTAKALMTLRACALTCRAWRPRSQLHLFQILRVDCSPSSPGGIDEITALLNGNSAIRLRIVALIAKGETAHLPSSLHVIPLKLPKYTITVHELRMGSGRFYPPRGIYPSMRQFKSVTKLTLSDITFHSLADLRQTVASFLAVKHFRLILPRWSDLDPSHRVPTSYPLCKARLYDLQIVAERAWLIDSRSTYLVEWFSRSGLVSDLHVLHTHTMMILNTKMLAAVTSIIETAKNTLRAVSLDFGPEVELGAGE